MNFIMKCDDLLKPGLIQYRVYSTPGTVHACFQLTPSSHILDEAARFHPLQRPVVQVQDHRHAFPHPAGFDQQHDDIDWGTVGHCDLQRAPPVSVDDMNPVRVRLDERRHDADGRFLGPTGQVQR